MKRKLFIISLLIFQWGSATYSQNHFLWGMASKGGANDEGVIFKMKLDGTGYEVIYSFNNLFGKTPTGNLIQASNGLLYGMTSVGGTNDNGILFSLNPANPNMTYIVLINFGGAGGGINKGSTPTGSLFQASDGKLYGMTSRGGINDRGVIFSFNPATNNFNKRVDMAGWSSGDLMQASDGNLYGTQYYAENSYFGSVFCFYPANDSVTYWNLNSTTPGLSINPKGKLIQDGAYLYGTSYGGGQCGGGAVFKFHLTNHSWLNDMNFCGSQPDYSSYPLGSLVKVPGTFVGQMTKFYGITHGVKFTDAGNIFSFNDFNTIHTVPVDFNVNIGDNPVGGLTLGSNGKIYGMTELGGSSPYDGLVFRFDPTTNSYTILHNFTGGTGDGSRPLGCLVEVICSPPSTPSTITGSPVVCAGLSTNYSISTVSGANSYIWTAAGGNIQGSSTGASIKVLFGNGGSNVKVKASNGCGLSGIRTKTITVSCREDEQEMNSKDMKAEVFPNPVNDLATLKFSSKENQVCELMIFENTGRILIHEEVNATPGLNLHPLYMSNLAKGIYLLKIKSSEGIVSKRIIKD